MLVDIETKEIICTAHGRGRQHDFKLFKASQLPLRKDTECLGDKGYQGIQKVHANSKIPQKKPRGGQLSSEDKQRSRELAPARVVIEHINRRLKVFKILAERYRNRRRRFSLRFNLIAGLYNYEIHLASTTSA